MQCIRVKICGITNEEDARLAVALGADLLGFIFYPRSPRCTTPEAARAIIDRLPPFVTPVAVTVNEPIARLRELLAVSGCRAAQLHGEEPPAYLSEVPVPVIRAASIADEAGLAALAPYAAARAFLLDACVPGQRGGTGVTGDWMLFRTARALGKPLILAGGLTAENVAEAIRVAEPDAVDCASGVEAAPGRKDPAKLRAFFAAVKAGTSR